MSVTTSSVPTPFAAPEPIPPTQGIDPNALTEIVGGRLVEKPPMSQFASRVAFRLAVRLFEYVREHPIGEVEHEMLCYLNPATGLARRPDVVFVGYDRYYPDGECPPEGELKGAPNLAVEVVSTHDRDTEVHSKIDEYFAHGVEQVWIIRPLNQSITIHTSPSESRTLRSEDRLESPLFPGLSVPIAPLFHRGKP